MAWIKVEHWTPEKPEVYQISESLGIDPDQVVGALVRLWIWADQQTTEGNAPSVSSALVDRKANVKGFADAMKKAGWLKDESGSLVFPNFGRHNGETAKSRALTAKRVEKHTKKTNANTNAESVSSALPRVRVRVLDTNISAPPPNALPTPAPDESTSVIPTADQVRTYAEGIGYQINAEYFVDHYGSTNWRAANGQPITNWKSLVRKWKINDEAKRHQESLGKRAANGLAPGQVIHDDRPETNAAAARLLEADRKGLRGY
jgi:hypothetical protein